MSDCLWTSSPITIIYTASKPLRTTGERTDLNRGPVVHRVLGRVLLWGRVVECQNGWRGARAYPERLVLPELTWGGRTVERLDAIALCLADCATPIEILDGTGGEYELAHALGQRHTA